MRTAALALLATAHAYTVSSEPDAFTSYSMDNSNELDWTWYDNNMNVGFLLYSDDPLSRFTLTIDTTLEEGYDYLRGADALGGVTGSHGMTGDDTFTRVTQGPNYFFKLTSDGSVTESEAFRISWVRQTLEVQPTEARVACWTPLDCSMGADFDDDVCVVNYASQCADEVLNCEESLECGEDLYDCLDWGRVVECTSWASPTSGGHEFTTEQVTADSSFSYAAGNDAEDMVHFYLDRDLVDSGYVMILTVSGSSVEDCCDKWMLRDNVVGHDASWTKGDTGSESLTVFDGDAWLFIDTDYSVTSTYHVTVDVIYLSGSYPSCAVDSCHYDDDFAESGNFPLEECTQSDCDKPECLMYFNLCGYDEDGVDHLWDAATSATEACPVEISAAVVGGIVGGIVACCCVAGAYGKYKRDKANRKPSPQVAAFQQAKAQEAAAVPAAPAPATTATTVVQPAPPPAYSAQQPMPTAAAIPTAQALPMAAAVPIAAAQPLPTAQALPVAQAIN